MMYLYEASLLGPLEVNPLLVIGETYMALYVSKKERNVCKESQLRMRIIPICSIKNADLNLILVHDERDTTLVDRHLHRRLGHGRRERSRDVVHRCRVVVGLGNLENKLESRGGRFIRRRMGPMENWSRGHESG